MNLSSQAKAVAALALTAVAQLSVVIGEGGVQSVANLTLGQWLLIVLATAGAYGVTYNVPNADAKPTSPEPEQVEPAPVKITLPPGTDLGMAVPAAAAALSAVAAQPALVDSH